MKAVFILFAIAAFNTISLHSSAQQKVSDSGTIAAAKTHLFIDVHQLQPGKVKAGEVAKAHAKDLAVEKKYGVHFIQYWVNEEKGLVYCLSSSKDSESIKKTHAEAHGLMPAYVYQVTDGNAAKPGNQKNYFLDVHNLGSGKVTAKDVAGAHAKDLAVEKKYGVNFINYWVDEKEGVVMCLSQAKNSAAIINTHKEAHGLLPDYVLKIKMGK